MQILGYQMAQYRLKSHRPRVDDAVSERQIVPQAAIQPSTWQANANVALGSQLVGRPQGQQVFTLVTDRAW